MLLTLLLVSVCSWQSAWAQDGVEVSVNLAEPGSLGVEILRKHDPITEVTKLTITGEMNDDDWSTLQNITNLNYLDLSGAITEEVPANQFNNKCSNLTTVILPTTLKIIGERAFYNKSNLVDVYFPTTLESLGKNAFDSCSKLESIHLDALPSGIKIIPYMCFCSCKKLQPFTIPEGVTSIEDYAFNGCELFTSTIPSTIVSFGASAFYNAAMNGIDVIIKEGAEISSYDHAGTFAGTKIKSISLPSTFYNNPAGVINSCKNLTDIYLKSPTVLDNPGRNSGFLYGLTTTNLKIHVPAHLLEAYKLNSYFKNYSSLFVGDATVGNGESWTISLPLTLSYSRMPASSNIILKNSTSLQVMGSDTQIFGDVLTYGHTYYSLSSYNYRNSDWSIILNTCDNVSITGTLKHKIQTYEKTWYFFSLPFDFKVGDIVTDNDVKFAIRYYDGANRANTNAAAENWKNYDNDDIVPAGTGFILQTSATTWVTFKAQDNESKQNVMSNSAFEKALADNSSEHAAHKGWNLVGNPWQSYYNIHKLNYTAPISVWDGRTYAAYSLSDDDYAIRPNEAFFVQSPGNNTVISFPVDGRQLTKAITSQNGSRAEASNRQIVDIQIAGGNELTDKTRLVVNPKASLGYEISCDASKFMSMSEQVPQIYSLGLDETQYAINERPADKGELRLGVVIQQDGQYTIAAIRNSLGKVLLRDNETGITTDLSQSGYSFDAKQGTYTARFVLEFGDGATAISGMKQAAAEAVSVYTLDGREVGQTTDGLKPGVYVVRKGQKAQKMIIK